MRITIRQTRIWAPLLCALAVLGVSLAHASAGTPAESPGMLSCRITVEGQPAKAAEAELRCMADKRVYRGVSDEAGYIFFSGLPAGRYTLRVYAPKGAMPDIVGVGEHVQPMWGMDGQPAFESFLYYDAVDIAAAGLFTGECNFVRNRRIEGEVLYEDGERAGDVALLLERRAADGGYFPFRACRTDGDGRFVMNEVPDGTYRLRNMAQGYWRELLEREWTMHVQGEGIWADLRLANPEPQE